MMQGCYNVRPFLNLRVIVKIIVVVNGCETYDWCKTNTSTNQKLFY